MTETSTSTGLSVPRRMWAHFERVHAVTYLTAPGLAAFEEVGLRGFWRAYFAGRAAPLGLVGAEPVIAAFFGFAPRVVVRALPDVWSRISPAAALDARRAGSRAALVAAIGDVDPVTVAEAAGLLRVAASAVELPGRVLGAANAALPWPDDDLDVLWHASTVLREHRGDGHVAALLTAGLDGCESLVWRAALAGSGLDFLEPLRGWTAAEVRAAADRLTDRGWLTGDGSPTEVARRACTDIERITDELAAGPWRVLGPERTARCAELLHPLAVRAEAQFRHPHPIGLPAL